MNNINKKKIEKKGKKRKHGKLNNIIKKETRKK
jgi:hypothetical protein